ncbi:MAG: dihydrofolate reductase [Nocardioidaceae bacterium]
MTGAGSTTRHRIVLVAAVADNGVIGKDGRMPWHLPEDLRHFREVTRGHPVVMGRVTFESIGRPLPDRANIVITRRQGWTADGVEVASDLEDALRLAAARLEDAGGDVMVIGGAQVYAAALDLADAQVLTEVHQTPEGDTSYPAFDRSEWTETRRDLHGGFDFVWLERVARPGR